MFWKDLFIGKEISFKNYIEKDAQPAIITEIKFLKDNKYFTSTVLLADGTAIPCAITIPIICEILYSSERKIKKFGILPKIGEYVNSFSGTEPKERLTVVNPTSNTNCHVLFENSPNIKINLKYTGFYIPYKEKIEWQK